MSDRKQVPTAAAKILRQKDRQSVVPLLKPSVNAGKTIARRKPIPNVNIESDVVGKAACKAADWIRDCKLVTVTAQTNTTPGEYKIISGNDILHLDKFLGGGTFGKAFRYSTETGNKTCAVKVLVTDNATEAPKIARGGIGHAKYIEATLSAQPCLIALTKFFYGGVVQVMELGNGTATDCAKSQSSAPIEFVKFSINVCQCLLSNGLASPDTKLDNMVFIDNCSDYPMAQFRLIDVDGITQCGFPDAYPTKIAMIPDVLYPQGVVMTYPIIDASYVLCPLMQVVETWYAFLVSIAQYYALYHKNDELYETLSINLYWANIEQYDVATYGIFPKEHPFMRILNMPMSDDIPWFVKDCVRNFSDIITNQDPKTLLYMCEDIMMQPANRVRDATWKANYKKYRAAFNEVKTQILDNITMLKRSIPFPLATHLFSSTSAYLSNV